MSEDIVQTFIHISNVWSQLCFLIFVFKVLELLINLENSYFSCCVVYVIKIKHALIKETKS